MVLESFNNRTSMLVSSHTVQVWTSWSHVPERLQKHRLGNENCTFVYFVPKVETNLVSFSKFPLNKSDIRIDLDDGVLFISTE